ncbi:Myomesin-1 [Portunus trituberculatus]|uniref:Myomesin-1 n=1 Tax=Portunus trituberculatus TaxID=210409 RepID=A0A5B7ERC2_PORTR|nr:Myomesin-1 [Portunus trituberculatus]
MPPSPPPGSPAIVTLTSDLQLHLNTPALTKLWPRLVTPLHCLRSITLNPRTPALNPTPKSPPFLPRPRRSAASSRPANVTVSLPTARPRARPAPCLPFTMNLTDTVATVSNLRTGNLYNFFVITMNEAGTSLPSAILTINVTEEHEDEGGLNGVSSAPHSLVLDAKTATTLTIVWQPPEFAHPTDRFIYELHFRALGTPGDPENYNITTTAATAIRLENLTPNTQYVIYVTATTDKGESRPSETLLAWTDPAYPAFVEDETRHMVTVVQNVTRDMREISCYADNGYGTPMQASRTITISREYCTAVWASRHTLVPATWNCRPRIKARERVPVPEGTSATLECGVDAWPEPSLVWWQDPEGRVPVIHGGNYAIKTETNQVRNSTSASHPLYLFLLFLILRKIPLHRPPIRVARL